MRLLLIAAFVLSTSFCQAQDNGYIGMGLGYNVLPYHNLNRIIDQYNSSRPWLEADMKSFNGMFSKAFVMGGYFGKMGMEIRYVRRKTVHEARGISPFTGQEEWRKLKVKNHTFSVGYMVRLNGGDRTVVSIGGSGDFGAFKISTKTSARERWIKLTSGMGLQGGATAFVHVWLTPNIAVKPYYNWVLARVNLENTHRTLNPSTGNSGVGDDTFNSAHHTFYDHMHNWGVELIINFKSE